MFDNLLPFVQELLEKKRQLDEKYATVGSEGHRNMKGADYSKSPVSSSSHYSLTRWMNLDEMQGQLKEKISEEQVHACMYIRY